MDSTENSSEFTHLFQVGNWGYTYSMNFEGLGKELGTKALRFDSTGEVYYLSALPGYGYRWLPLVSPSLRSVPS